jgi:hypothetical protein
VQTNSSSTGDQSEQHQSKFQDQKYLEALRTTEAQLMQVITNKQRQEQSQEDRRREDSILQHLRFPTLDVRYEEIDPAHAKTFNWIFEGFESRSSSSFSDWLEGKGKDESLFWVYGKAGSGKSTLMKYIYEDPRTKEKLAKWVGDQTLTMASFFFWSSGNVDQCSQTGLLRSLLHHLLLQHRHLIREVFPDLWETLKISVTLRAWSLSYATKALVYLLGRDLGRVVFFIDGLDEYHGDHGNHLSGQSPENHVEIVSLINSLSSPNVKICFSSRPLQIFHNNFDLRPKLRLQDLTSSDIYTYVKDKLVDDSEVAVLRSEHDWEPSELVSRVVERAEGVFLWVVLVVRSLLSSIHNSDDFQELENRLEHTPSNVMELYRHMLKQIQPYYLAEGCKIFAMADLALIMAQKQKEDQRSNFSRGHYEELCMIGLWFGLEHSKLDYSGMAHSQSLSSDVQIVRAISEIDRKLKTRCAGLLEAGRAMPTEDWQGRDWYHGDNVLMETRFGNRRLQYIHRSAKEFLDLKETNALLKSAMALSHDPKISLLWSALQRIRIYRPEQSRPMVDRTPKNDLLCLADSALLMARGIQDEGKPCPVELLDLLDYNMQGKQSQQEFSWVTDAMSELYSYHSRYEKPHNYISETSEIVWLDPHFEDDFLSLAVIYGLLDYVESKIKEQPFIVKQKRGRPYLDYALASHNKSSVDVHPKIVQMLLRAGANPDENCPTVYSIAEWDMSGNGGRYVGFGYTTWTPWQSALQSILWTAAGKRTWQSATLNLQQRQDWIEVFKYLLGKEPDVSIETWVCFKVNPDEAYTVSETITTVFAEGNPQEAEQLLLMVENLARLQSCPIYKTQIPSDSSQLAAEQVSSVPFGD